MPKTKETCKNCNKEFNKKFNYCPYCGQQVNDALTIKVLFYNTISNYFSFDARFLKSFFPLMLKPGYLASRFIEGKRLLYLHPAQMYLFVAVIFFFLFSFVQREQVQNLDAQLEKPLVAVGTDSNISLDTEIKISTNEVEKNYSVKPNVLQKELETTSKSQSDKNNSILNFDSNAKKIDSLIAIEAPDNQVFNEMGMSNDASFLEKRVYAQALKLYKSRKGGSILQAFFDAIPIAMFFLLPIFALILKLLYLKKGVYAHHLVFSFYYFSFLFTVFSIILGVNFLIDIPDWIDILLILSTFIYLFMALKYFYKQSWLKSFLKSTVTSLVFLMFVAPLAVFVLVVFAFLFY
ncbi:DUF3667 domain-containing protein [Cognatitamlana onchidii]|uniref:DUF3667 domain-containing protein n=1 Tax=Cognatitamlana onchidii TaxID=2562860 RepID=UPI0010A64FBC|nr:DUF3667 domain-containing protein [Algibacter onchidii]